MKLLYFNDYRLGVLRDDTVIDITDILLDIPHRDTLDLMNGLNIIIWRLRFEELLKLSIIFELKKITKRPKN